MLIPSFQAAILYCNSSLSRRVNANSQQTATSVYTLDKLIKKGEC